MSELKTIIVDGVKYVEVPVEELIDKSQTKFKVGDFAKPNGNYHCVGLSGAIVKITDIRKDSSFPITAVSINDHQDEIFRENQLEPYTPKAGDVLSVANVEYRLVERKAKKGEKVIVVKVLYHGFDINSIVTAINNYEKFEGASISEGYAQDGQQLLTREYLVLESTADEKCCDDGYEPVSVIVITELNGTKHEIDYEHDVDDFVMDFEDNGNVAHSTVFIPKGNIASITKVVR
jgi:hypothetical protein